MGRDQTCQISHNIRTKTTKIKYEMTTHMVCIGKNLFITNYMGLESNSILHVKTKYFFCIL